MPFYESEGEVNNMLFYKKYDYIPQILVKYLVEHKINFEILKKHSRSHQLIRIFLRRFCILCIKPFVYLLANLTFRYDKNFSFGRYNIILLSRSLAHTHLFFPLQEASNKFLILYNDGFFSKGINHSFFVKHHGKGVPLFSFLKMRNIFKNFILIHKSLITTHFIIPRYVVFKGLCFPLRSVMREFLISYYDAIIYADSLSNFLNQNPYADLVVTGETFTQFPYVINESLNKTNIKFIQYECGTLDIMPNVDFIFSQKFLVSSEDVCLKYKELHFKEAHKIQFWGNTKKIGTSFKQFKVVSKIIYFSQPYENESQLSILKCLYEMSVRQGIQVDIKPHPRDYEVIKIAEKYGFGLIDKISLFSEYIRNYDLAIARTSSIVKDIILSRIPFLIALFSEQEKNTESEFISSKYKIMYKEIYIFDDVCLRDTINNPHEIYTVCNSFFQAFKRENSSIDLENLSLRLTEYSKESKFN
jgi:hypothetical protein